MEMKDGRVGATGRNAGVMVEIEGTQRCDDAAAGR